MKVNISLKKGVKSPFKDIGLDGFEITVKEGTMEFIKDKITIIIPLQNIDYFKYEGEKATPEGDKR